MYQVSIARYTCEPISTLIDPQFYRNIYSNVGQSRLLDRLLIDAHLTAYLDATSKYGHLQSFLFGYTQFDPSIHRPQLMLKFIVRMLSFPGIWKQTNKHEIAQLFRYYGHPPWGVHSVFQTIAEECNVDAFTFRILAEIISCFNRKIRRLCLLKIAPVAFTHPESAQLWQQLVIENTISPKSVLRVRRENFIYTCAEVLDEWLPKLRPLPRIRYWNSKRINNVRVLEILKEQEGLNAYRIEQLCENSNYEVLQWCLQWIKEGVSNSTIGYYTLASIMNKMTLTEWFWTELLEPYNQTVATLKASNVHRSSTAFDSASSDEQHIMRRFALGIHPIKLSTCISGKQIKRLSSLVNVSALSLRESILSSEEHKFIRNMARYLTERQIQSLFTSYIESSLKKWLKLVLEEY